LKDFNAERACKEAREIAKMSIGAKMGREGRFDVLLSPLCMGNLIDHISFQTSAFYVDSGLSFFKDKLGQMVASPIVNLHDDGTREDGLGSWRFDEEGVPSRNNTIIKDGELQTYLHNTSTAKKHGVETTANAGLISPEPTNMVLEEGDYNFEEMLEELSNGLYITNNWYTRFQNYSTGDFSTIPRDGIFVVENGEIVGSIREIRISDNMQRILKNISALGNDPRHIHWWEAETPCFTPHVLIRDVNVTKSRG
jgi:PmbA protein